MSGNQEHLQRLVNELGCQPEAPDIPTLLVLLIQEQRRTNDVMNSLSQSIAQLAMSIVEQDADAPLSEVDQHAGLG